MDGVNECACGGVGSAFSSGGFGCCLGLRFVCKFTQCFYS
ncbi:hypothetical protein EJK51_1520 [Moraxella catarrhalis]|uniref:Uncharacterized protein n=1 Tax=Moraxella catarrhalis TaxID=480 RepID=A0A3Q9GFW1_MORCA|nr:hypothetical protein MCR_1449 [Moraxella catarrhalis BBH18]AZQ86925.1 hypothetical protein EJK52_1521 [Moraxella catarrhalis]AZQ91102.1 hypothetical protein EJK51_1520 [Moraxella catarrhalis]AZQ93147.1 hypothetical protein EJK53_1775 [Moraxella catarrhalis]